MLSDDSCSYAQAARCSARQRLLFLKWCLLLPKVSVTALTELAQRCSHTQRTQSTSKIRLLDFNMRKFWFVDPSCHQLCHYDDLGCERIFLLIAALAILQHPWYPLCSLMLHTHVLSMLILRNVVDKIHLCQSRTNDVQVSCAAFAKYYIS